MVTATIRAAYTQNGAAYLHAEVAEGGQTGNVEYRGSVLLTAPLGARSSDGVYVDWATLSAADQAAAPNNGTPTTIANLTAAQRKAALVVAVKAVRDAQLAGVNALAITGAVTV